MKHLPASPDLDHLKKQAKHLLRDLRAGDSASVQRFADNLPAVHGVPLSAIAERDVKLHDAQSVVAREYGFKSWPELRRYVVWKRETGAKRLKEWLKFVYDGNARERRIAVRLLAEEPEMFAGDQWIACAIGDVAAVQTAIAADSKWVNRSAGVMTMPPLVAVTSSRLILEEGFAERLVVCARLLLQHGADPNSAWTNPQWPDTPLTAIYGASGRTHNVEMTRLLLEAGADPNDNESLYHSVEGRDVTCTRLLLEAGARVNGTNALGRVLDYDKLDALKLMLQHGGTANERPWIHHAILRGRSIEHIRTLVDAGAELRKKSSDGISIYRWAQMHGRADVVALLEDAGVTETLNEVEEFIAACTQGDADAAMRLKTDGIFERMTEKQLQTLPEMAAAGGLAAVRTMVGMGWPMEVKAGWGATPLHHAIYRGNADMVDYLLQHGADWTAKNGFGGGAMSTLAHASQSEDMEQPAERNYLGCAKALDRHRVPLPDLLEMAFSPEVMEFFERKGGSEV